MSCLTQGPFHVFRCLGIRVVAQVLGKIKHERTSGPTLLFCKALALSFLFFYFLPFVVFFSISFQSTYVSLPAIVNSVLPFSCSFKSFPLFYLTCDDVAKRLKKSLRFKEMLERKMVKRKQRIGWPTRSELVQDLYLELAEISNFLQPSQLDL